jgi:hypothetical protein
METLLIQEVSSLLVTCIILIILIAAIFWIMVWDPHRKEEFPPLGSSGARCGAVRRVVRHPELMEESRRDAA